jgi:hypothetical protein
MSIRVESVWLGPAPGSDTDLSFFTGGDTSASKLTVNARQEARRPDRQPDGVIPMHEFTCLRKSKIGNTLPMAGFLDGVLIDECF